MTRKFDHLNADNIIHEYISGKSQAELASINNVSRGPILRILIESNVVVRSCLEANRILASNRTPEQNRQYTEAAHNAARGRKQTIEERSKGALTRELYPSNIGKWETILSSMLFKHGISTIPQKAIGPYNCDLAAYPVAVEVFGGNFHFSGSAFDRLPKRIHYILNSGWNIIMINVGRRRPITEETARYLVSYIQSLCCFPAIGCEYRMIWGTGELVIFGSSNDDEITIKETLCRAKNIIRNDPGSTW